MTERGCYAPSGTSEVDGVVLEHFEAGPHTSSAWGRHMQHGGPVTALLVRASERVGDADGRRIARVTTELLTRHCNPPVSTCCHDNVTKRLFDLGENVAHAADSRLVFGIF